MQQKPYILILAKKLLSLTVISQGDFKKKLPPLTSQSSNFLVHDIQKCQQWLRFLSSCWTTVPSQLQGKAGKDYLACQPSLLPTTVAFDTISLTTVFVVMLKFC